MLKSSQLGQPLRHQVWETCRIRAKVTEHQFYTCQCRGCEALTRHPHPPTVPTGNFGPRLSATIATLHGRYRVSLRKVQALAQDLWQVELSLGAISDLCHKTSLALAPAYQQAQLQVQFSPVTNAPVWRETGWYKAGKGVWLWVAVSAVATLFMIAKSRSRASFHSLVGQNYGGVVGSDRYNAYYAKSGASRV